MAKISKSPERHTFQRDKYIEQQTERGLMDTPETQAMLEYYRLAAEHKAKREQDPEWQKNNLEYDLRTTDWILEKVRASASYAQHLYAALCNNEFTKNDVFEILKESEWSCSWRYAGGIIADMREEGDYMDWYCSGIRDDYSLTSFIGEGNVTDEIQQDLLKLGWIVREYESE